ncbi:DUF6437 family protein [Paenibacillus kribbensis]|uniref:DUF6437 family protein n=1 Tax=Paenibacillus kribbensis TaxID=172713 RepID=UPI002DB616E1|nr:DUF6437 family protein [Paenibacillus kribbensis]MEC0238192.1 DUF6437 family protein [Paenibacillus kribbensis]
MARTKKSSLAQVQKIEEQIKELREKQKQLVEKAQSEIGEYLMETWQVEDIEMAKKMIDKFKDEARASFTSSDKIEGNNTQNNSPSMPNNHTGSGS